MLFSYQDIISQAKKIQERYVEYVQEYGMPYYCPEKGVGWAITPNARHRTLDANSNQLGFRKTISDENDVLDLPKISFWGSSIVEGCELLDEYTWLWRLQEKMKGDFAICNGGVSAYGTDQAFLRFKQRFQDVKPKVAFLGYATTDLLRNLSIERMFLMKQGGEFLFLKPRYIISPEGQLELIVPSETNYENLADVLQEAQTKSLLKRYDPFFVRCSLLRQLHYHLLRKCGIDAGLPKEDKLKEEALQIVWGIFKEFMGFCSENDIEGRILFLPIYKGLNQSGSDFDTLIQKLYDANYPYVDLREIFVHREKYAIDELYEPKNHYSRLSGEWISSYLANYIQGTWGNE